VTETDHKKRDSTNIVRSPGAELARRSSDLVRRALRELSERDAKVTTDVVAAPKPRVLVVDDEPLIADLFAEILSRNGYDAVAVHTPAAGVRRARVFQPHVALLGCVMPQIGGVDLGVELSKIVGQIKIVIITEPVPRQVLDELRSRGYRFDAFTVPFNPEEFLEKMRSWTAEAFVNGPERSL